MNQSASRLPDLPVLVAEPDEDDRNFVVSALTSAGIEVVGTGNFTSARAYLEAKAPPLLVTEMRLGSYSGLYLALLGRHIRPEMSLVMTSRFHDPVLRRRSKEIGAVCVQKPMTQDDLFAAVFHATLQELTDDAARSVVTPFQSWEDEYREIVLAGADVGERHQRRRRKDIATFLFLEGLRR